MSIDKQLSALIDPLLKLTDEEGQELMPFRSTTLELVYGDMEYIRSVFGSAEITRQILGDYYDNARVQWPRCDIPKGVDRVTVTRWCKTVGIRPLHYYCPMYDHQIISFKDVEDAFAFKLKFGA